MRALIVSLCGLVYVHATAAFAVTQQQQDRLDAFGRYTVTAPWCQTLGMTLPNDAGKVIGDAMQRELATWQGDQGSIDKSALEALDRQQRMLESDMETVVEAAKTPEQLRGLRAVIVRLGGICLDASRDSIFSQIVHAPAGFDLEREATRLMDEHLQVGGLATWQTPEIQARGDIMMVAGACRRKIGAALSDEIVATYGRSEDARTRDYYLRSFDKGMSDTDLNFDKPQCERVIARFRAKINGGP